MLLYKYIKSFYAIALQTKHHEKGHIGIYLFIQITNLANKYFFNSYYVLSTA